MAVTHDTKLSSWNFPYVTIGICIGPDLDDFRGGCFNTSSIRSGLAHSHGVGADPIGSDFLWVYCFGTELEGPVNHTRLVRRCCSQ